MEREYARIRGAETRYRLLFQLAGEPILVLDANSTRVVECNPAAGRLLSRDPRRIAGQTLAELFARASSGAVQSAVAAVRVTGRVEDARVALHDGTDLRMSASLFRQDGGSQILVRVAAPAGNGDALPAASSGLLRAIEAMPEGVLTIVGERGVQLSGGQKQRVALARALLAGPKVLILDDPLSAVDTRTEAAILDAIDAAAHGRTLVMVTHRVSAAARCDRIVVLDQGRVAEQGTHAALLAKGGIYARLAERQAIEAELETL